MQDEVGHGLEGLLLAHDEADLLGLLVAEELGVAGTSLLPLVVADSVELGTDSEDALLEFLTSNLLHCGELSLKFSKLLVNLSSKSNLLWNIVSASLIHLPGPPSSLRGRRSQRREQQQRQL